MQESKQMTLNPLHRNIQDEIERLAQEEKKFSCLENNARLARERVAQERIILEKTLAELQAMPSVSAFSLEGFSSVSDIPSSDQTSSLSSPPEANKDNKRTRLSRLPLECSNLVRTDLDLEKTLLKALFQPIDSPSNLEILIRRTYEVMDTVGVQTPIPVHRIFAMMEKDGPSLTDNEKKQIVSELSRLSEDDESPVYSIDEERFGLETDWRERAEAMKNGSLSSTTDN